MNVSDNLITEVYSDVSDKTINLSIHPLIWWNVRSRTSGFVFNNVRWPLKLSYKRNMKNIYNNLNNAYNIF